MIQDQITPAEAEKCACATAETYLRAAVASVCQMFGAGAAASHPELVSAFMVVCAKDYLAWRIGRGLDGIAQALECLPTANVGELTEPLRSIADEIRERK